MNRACDPESSVLHCLSRERERDTILIQTSCSQISLRADQTLIHSHAIPLIARIGSVSEDSPGLLHTKPYRFCRDFSAVNHFSGYWVVGQKTVAACSLFILRSRMLVQLSTALFFLLLKKASPPRNNWTRTNTYACCLLIASEERCSVWQQTSSLRDVLIPGTETSASLSKIVFSRITLAT